MRLAILLLGLACFGIEAVWHEDIGPSVNATKGEMFPQARIKHLTDGLLILKSDKFYYTILAHTCDILDNALIRYYDIIMEEARIASKAAQPISGQEDDIRGNLTVLEVNLRNPCEQLPYLHMNENYTLEIHEISERAIVTADSIWGILRGFESFSQLFAASPDGYLVIRCQKIEDFPRFPHRGLSLDTSRHYIPVEDIMLTLDAMSYNKLNVFHWHIIDDNSFPYASTAFPELSAKGAYHPLMVYTPNNVTAIVEHARLRGIRVIIEFDTPAHSKSLAKSHPELLTECWDHGKPNGKLGPMNPTKPEVLTFLTTLFNELFRAFPDRYFHLGGNKIPFRCWESNPDVIDYMKKHGIYTLKNLEKEFLNKLLQLTKTADLTPIVWEEVFTTVGDLPREVVVQIWRDPWQFYMRDVLHHNHSAILSSCWYLDDPRSTHGWVDFYNCEPLNFEGTPKMKSRVLGGEACMWSNYVDRNNLHSRIWPRASAVAERLWSNPTYNTMEAAQRLEEHVCRMNRRRIGAQPPTAAGFCFM